MNPEEAKSKIEELTSLLKYEQNLKDRSNGYVNSKQTARAATKMEESLLFEIKELRKYL